MMPGPFSLILTVQTMPGPVSLILTAAQIKQKIVRVETELFFTRKLSANEQFFVVVFVFVFFGVQTVVRLLQTTQTKQGVSFIAANKVYTCTNKTTIF